MRRSDRQLRAPNWSANWIFIFSHKGDKSEWEKGFAEWPCLTASSFFSSSSSIPHATSQSLSPNLLCSTWKDSGYHSFGFSAPLIPSGSIRSSRSRVRPPLDDIFYRCLGGPRNPPATGVDKWTWGGHVNIARGKQSEEAGGGGATAVITPRAVLWILMLLTFV